MTSIRRLSHHAEEGGKDVGRGRRVDAEEDQEDEVGQQEAEPHARRALAR